MAFPQPYTIHEALFGNDGLEPCVSSVTHEFHPVVRERLCKFNFLITRPKQASQHMLELFILQLCRIDPYWNVDVVDGAVDSLVQITDHLIPPVTPAVSCFQWTALVHDCKRRVCRRVSQSEPSYPSTALVDTDAIVRVIAENAVLLPEATITTEQLSEMTGLMDEPAKTAVMAYAWFLASVGVNNGWLVSFLTAPLGRRERPPHLPSDVSSQYHQYSADGRLGRSNEELHTLYAPPFVNRHGQLVWYTIRTAWPGEVIGRTASVYAVCNRVRIHSCKSLSRSVQIHHSHVCNARALDIRLWQSWTHSARSVGTYKSLSNCAFSSRSVSFDAPVRLEGALGVGFRVVTGVLFNPDGKRLAVIELPDGLFKAKLISYDAIPEPVPWHNGMKFV